MAHIRDPRTGKFIDAPKPHCMDCGKRISSFASKRCVKCHYAGVTAKNLGVYAQKGTTAGSKNVNWKGDKVGYYSLHNWIKRQLGKPTYCSNDPFHKSSLYHWSNISGLYLRDLSDWHSLCPSCNKTDGVKKAKRFIDRRIFA